MKIKNIAFVGIPVTVAMVQDLDGNKLIIHKLKPENEKGVCK
ncbi:MAG TPA: hypothetical protein VGI59_00295 [Candidatus Udaeobacter sp.]